MTLSDEIIKIVKDKANNNPAPTECTITQVNDGYVQVTTSDGAVLNNLIVLGNPTRNTKGIIVYLDGSYNTPIVIPSIDETTNMILALGLGLFHINNNGDLIVELPVGVDNYFLIDENGDLCIDTEKLPVGTSNDWVLKDDGNLYFKRGE